MQSDNTEHRYSWAQDVVRSLQSDPRILGIIAIDTESTQQRSPTSGQVKNVLSEICVVAGNGSVVLHVRIHPAPGWVVTDWLTDYSGLTEEIFYDDNVPIMTDAAATQRTREVMQQHNLIVFCGIADDLPVRAAHFFLSRTTALVPTPPDDQLLGVAEAEIPLYPPIVDIRHPALLTLMQREGDPNPISLAAMFSYFFGALHQEPVLVKYQTSRTWFGRYRLGDGRMFDDVVPITGHSVISDCRATVAIALLLLGEYDPTFHKTLPNPVTFGWLPLYRASRYPNDAAVEVTGRNIIIVGAPDTAVVLAVALHVNVVLGCGIDRVLLNKGIAKLYLSDVEEVTLREVCHRLRRDIKDPSSVLSGWFPIGAGVFIADGISVPPDMRSGFASSCVQTEQDLKRIPATTAARNVATLLANNPFPRYRNPLPIADHTWWSEIFPGIASAPLRYQRRTRWGKSLLAWLGHGKVRERSPPLANWGATYCFRPTASGWSIPVGIKVQSTAAIAACRPLLDYTGPPPAPSPLWIPHPTGPLVPSPPVPASSVPAPSVPASSVPAPSVPAPAIPLQPASGPPPAYMSILPPGHSPTSKKGHWLPEDIVRSIRDRYNRIANSVPPPGHYYDGIHLKDSVTHQIVRDPTGLVTGRVHAWERLNIFDYIPHPPFWADWQPREKDPNRNANSGPQGKGERIKELMRHCVKYQAEWDRVRLWLDAAILDMTYTVDQRALFAYVRNRFNP